MGGPYFIWNGIDSRSMGVRLAAYPPLYRAPETVASVTVPGRSGTLTLLEGADVRGTVAKVFKVSNRRGADVQSILSWLSGGGRMVFGNEPGYAYEGRITQAVELSKLYDGVWEGSVTFEAQPYRMQAIEPGPLTLLSAGTVFNPGDVPARPVITVTGTGDFTLTLGGSTLAVADTTDINSGGGFLIDLSAEIVTSLDRTQWLTQYSSGDWPSVPPGASSVSWTGLSVTAVTMTQPWRWR